MVVVAVFGGIHLESLSHLLLFLAALADLVEVGFGDFGDLTHLEVSGDLDGPDGHCHELVDGVVVVGPVGFGAGAGAGVVVVALLGLTITLFGQDKFGGLFALYLGAVVVGVLSFCSEELVAAVGVVVVFGAAGDLDLLSNVAVGPGPSYGSFGSAGLLNNLIMSCDKPIGLFGVGVEELDVVVAVVVDDCGPVRVLDDDVLLGAVAGDVDLADVCGPVRALGIDELLGAVGKKLSDV